MEVVNLFADFKLNLNLGILFLDCSYINVKVNADEKNVLEMNAKRAL